MSNVGSSYSQIIHPSDYSRIMSQEHLYIADSDHFIIQNIKEIVSPFSEIVELGCGPGRVLSQINQIKGINLTGVEPDPYFASYAKNLVKNSNTQVIIARAEDYRHPRKVNIFYSQGMHHHVAKGIPTQTYLNNIYSSLNDDGCYILSDEFLSPYSDLKDREKKVVIWHAHIIADAIKNNYNYLAQEEAKTLLDDLYEGRSIKYIKSKKQIDFILSKVEIIDQIAQKGEEEEINQLVLSILEELESYYNLNVQGDPTVDLSRGDFKICESVLKQELDKANFKIESVKSIGPLQTSGALSIYIIKKS